MRLRLRLKLHIGPVSRCFWSCQSRTQRHSAVRADEARGELSVLPWNWLEHARGPLTQCSRNEVQIPAHTRQPHGLHGPDVIVPAVAGIPRTASKHADPYLRSKPCLSDTCTGDHGHNLDLDRLPKHLHQALSMGAVSSFGWKMQADREELCSKLVCRLLPVQVLLVEVCSLPT